MCKKLPRPNSLSYGVCELHASAPACGALVSEYHALTGRWKQGGHTPPSTEYFRGLRREVHLRLPVHHHPVEPTGSRSDCEDVQFVDPNMASGRTLCGNCILHICIVLVSMLGV